jgi:hypothetical protein
MIKYIAFLFLFLFSSFTLFSQNYKQEEDKIEQAEEELTESIEAFSADLMSHDLDSSVSNLLNSISFKKENAFHNFVLGCVLYKIDPKTSFQLQKKAYELNPKNTRIILEFALELHRIRAYREASELYEIYLKENPEDVRYNALLSECYFNLNETEKGIQHWKLASHAKNHTGIEKCIYFVHGDYSQFRRRNDLRKRIQLKDDKAAAELIFLDLNWEEDWWNTSQKEFFCDEDIQLIIKHFGEKSDISRLLKSYSIVKKITNTTYSQEDIKEELTDYRLILNNGKIPEYGVITSDLFRICLNYNLIEEKEFLNDNEKWLIQKADTLHDIELLNIVAFLQAEVNDKVSEEIDKKGWEQFHNENFAVSYFIGKGINLKSTDPELEKALIDFPFSAALLFKQVNAKRNEGIDYKQDLLELIKREFKSIQSDGSRSSYNLKSFILTYEELSKK